MYNVRDVLAFKTLSVIPILVLMLLTLFLKKLGFIQVPQTQKYFYFIIQQTCSKYKVEEMNYKY